MGLYPLTEPELTKEPIKLEKCLYNPIKDTGFEALLEVNPGSLIINSAADEAGKMCPKSLVRTISKDNSNRVT